MATAAPHPPDRDRASLAWTLVGFLILWVVLDRSAAALGSLRGEAGFAVSAATLAAALAVEVLLTRRGPLRCLADLGLRPPTAKPLIGSLALAAVLVAFFPIFALATGASLSLRPDWLLLALGIFAQGGIAEEVVFRGFLFRRLRVGRAFWPAAGLAAVPFVAVHLLLFATLAFEVAAASLLVAVSLSFPLAWLFDRSGGSIWPPAVVHAVVQGAIKLVDAGDASGTMLTAWLAISTLLPWIVVPLLRPKRLPGRAG